LAENLFLNILVDPGLFRRVHLESEIQRPAEQFSQGMAGVDLHPFHYGRNPLDEEVSPGSAL